jgi:hypothetical protein
MAIAAMNRTQPFQLRNIEPSHHPGACLLNLSCNVSTLA